MVTVFTPAEIFDLRGLRAVVIGGTGVLGARFSRCLAAAGAEVAVLGRSADRGQSVVDTIVGSGGQAFFAAVDVSERENVVAVAEGIAALGGVDVLVNASGVNSATPFTAISEDEWHHILDVNLGAVFRVCQAFAPHMRKRERISSIINVSSSAASPPVSRVLAYGVSKAGVDNITQYLARELAPDGIRVNAIIPGFFPAEQNRKILDRDRVENIIRHTPMRRLGAPEELDGALLWLASSRASGFVTGSLVTVDGGFSAMTI